MNQFYKTMERIRRALEHAIGDFESSAADFFAGIFNRQKIRKSLPGEVSQHDHKRAARILETGREYYNKKRHKKAAKYFRKAIDVDGRYGLAHYYYGLALYKRSHLKKARAAWQRAIDVDPKSDAADKARDKLGNRKLGSGREVRVMEPGGED